MKYHCLGCEKNFEIPGKVRCTPPTIELPTATGSTNIIGSNYEYSYPCCPFCYSKEIEESKEN